MGLFNWAQTFYVDKSLVQNSTTVGITRISLFFKNKPKTVGNKSGISGPGVEVQIVKTLQGVPIINLAAPIARTEYSAIVADSTAQAPTVFRFRNPVNLPSNQEYAIIIKFDGDEDFELWSSRQGDFLIDKNGNLTNTPSPGPSGKYIGKLFSYINSAEEFPGVSNTDNIILSTSDQSTPDQTVPDIDYLLTVWKPLNDTDLKFKVEIARYATAGSSVQSNTEIANGALIEFSSSNNVVVLSNDSIRFICPAYPMEYVNFDLKTSSTDDIHYGDLIYQSQPYYPGGKATPATVSVSNVSMSLLVTTPNTYVLSDNSIFDFTKLFNITAGTTEYIVVTSLNHYGANQHAVNVRKILRSMSNNAFLVNEPFTFTNSAAYFFKSPVGRLYSKSRPYVSGHTTDLIVLADSNANDSCRFVNNQIANVSIISGGSGYSNTDYLLVNGFENVTNELLGGYRATANIITYANGRIQNIYFSNAGAGFVNTSTITYSIVNSSALTSVGTGANLSFGVDAVLYSSFNGMNTFFKGCKILNLEAQNLLPDLQIDNPQGTIYTLKFKSLYSVKPSANTISKVSYYINTTESAIELDVRNQQFYNFGISSHPVIVSRSNQFVIGYANGAIPNNSVIGYPLSNTAVFYVDTHSNNDFIGISLNPKELNSYYAKYNINNDYTRENTNYGNAYAKHVTTKVTLANGQSAEDMLVYLTAIRPPNTDFKVFARIHNSHDPEAFDDKDWTILEQIDGLGVYTSITNPSDRCELTYGFRLYPNTTLEANTTTTVSTSGVLPGVVTCALNSSTVTGVGTNFNTSLAAGNLVKIYQPLFANVDYVVAVVNTVVNSTVFTISSPISNNSLQASGMKVAKVYYPLQVFKNITNDNVARYFNSSQVEFDTFDTYQIKVVFLSPDNWFPPKVDDLRAVAVTA